MIDDPTWVYRRKDSIELLSEHVQRHHMSVDFALPGTVSRTTDDGSQRMYYAPIALLRKAPAKFSRFDLHDETGRSLPLPTRARNGQVSGAALIKLARRNIGELPDGLPDALRVVANADGTQGPALWRKLVLGSGPFCLQLPRVLADDPDFAWLGQTLASNSIIVIPISGPPGERRVIKLSYEEELDSLLETATRPALRDRLARRRYGYGWQPYSPTITSPYASARNYHFEFHLPAGMRIANAVLWDTDRRQVLDSKADAEVRPRVHLYHHSAQGTRTVTAAITCRVTAGLAGSASITSSGIWFALTVAALIATFGPEYLAQTPTSAPTLLLLFPGIVATYLAQTQHPLVVRLLFRARRTLAAAAGWSYLGAACLAALGATPPACVVTALQVSLWFAVAAAAWSAAKLYRTRRATQGKALLPDALNEKRKRRRKGA